MRKTGIYDSFMIQKCLFFVFSGKKYAKIGGIVLKTWLLNGTVTLAAMSVLICALPFQAMANTENNYWAKNSQDIHFTMHHTIWYHAIARQGDQNTVSSNDNVAVSQVNRVSENSGYNVAVSDGFQKVLPLETIDPLHKLGYTKEKYALVFGSVENSVYQSAAEAAANMVSITIDVWQLQASGEKYAAKRTLTVNKAVADEVKAIFQEIFEGPEKFPIKCVGGYAWRPENTSEHRWGLAIDINWNENYMITSSGVIVAGSFWDPGKSPYSIPLTGDVVTAFNKHGFTWGGNAWRSSNDYMHFSYLGR